MLKMGIEDLKVEFVRNVYESITRQIQQMDLKISILLSWIGAIAVMLGREISIIYTNKYYHILPFTFVLVILVCLIIAGLNCYRVLKPRNIKVDEGFSGLLYSGDILKLGKDSQERMHGYINGLLKIDSYDKLYEQFVKSIVLISEIHSFKNQKFIRGLLTTVTAFIFLIGLMAVLGMNFSKF